MNKECTDDPSAWVEMQDWKKGYGRAISGMQVCNQTP